ncbi:MAG: hypothetical protein K2M36_02460, partial [Clostridia bacterium]|nr:hypothetical protein [Clostridia bacterium]
LKDEFAGNVGVKYNGSVVEETTPFLFKTPSDEYPEDFVEIPSAEELTVKYPYTGEEITFKLGDWYDSSIMVVVGELKGTDVGEYPVIVGFKKGAYTAWGTEDEYVSTIIVTYVIYEDSNAGRFVLTDEAAANHPFKFQYGEGFKVYDKDISEYVYSEADELFMTRLAYNDTLADLLAQFKNGNEIKVFDAKDVEITNMSQVLATGIVLRLMEGTTV